MGFLLDRFSLLAQGTVHKSFSLSQRGVYELDSRTSCVCGFVGILTDVYCGRHAINSSVLAGFSSLRLPGYCSYSSCARLPVA